MYNEAWMPKEKTPKNVLVLGESHYDEPNTQGQVLSFTTSSVIEYYIYGGIGTKFFSNIASSFGYTKEYSKLFYDKVYFGNYVDELCGIGDWSRAKNFVNKNRLKYNKELFSFCNDNGIDIIVCFSILCYDAMPKREGYEKPQEKIMIGEIAKQKNHIRKFIYCSGERKECSVALKKDLIVYGVRHPSCKSGYNIKQVYDFMVGDKDISWLCKK